jgi:hypothetical protein
VRRLLIAAACLSLVGAAASGCGSEETRVEGQGYSFELPDGWKDRSDTEEAKELNFIGFSPDTVVTGERTEGFSTNVNVIRQGSVDRGVSARQVAEASVKVLRNPRLLGREASEALGNFRARDVSALQNTKLDGEDAVRYTYTASRGGQLLRLRQVIAVHDGAAYTVTFTTLRDQFGEEAGDLEPILSSWSWR